MAGGAIVGGVVAVGLRHSPAVASYVGGLAGAAIRAGSGYSLSGAAGTLGDAANAAANVGTATFVGGAAGAVQGALPGARLLPSFGRAGSSILTGNAGASAALAGSLVAMGVKAGLDGICQ
jgi:hypothetical protein